LEQFVRIELFGIPLTLKAETDAAKAQEVADYLVGEVAKVEQRLGAAPPRVTQNAVLILTALNIINEFFELKRDHQELLDKIFRKTEYIIQRLSESPATGGE
jgi:cell division protein ZapA (FtsZ GTPase activity inhibitor)